MVEGIYIKPLLVSQKSVLDILLRIQFFHLQGQWHVTIRYMAPIELFLLFTLYILRFECSRLVALVFAFNENLFIRIHKYSIFVNLQIILAYFLC